MPSIINATTSTGLVTTADNSGSLQLATNSGTTALTITTAQRVGIGTTTPTTNLQVTGAGSGTFGAYNDPLNVKGSDYTLLYVNGTNGVAATIYNYNSSNGWYTGTNNSAGYRIGYMSSIDQTGVSNAKDGGAGITVTTGGNVLVGATSLTTTEQMLIQSAVTTNSRITLTVYNTTATSTTRASSTLIRVLGNGTSADASMVFSDNATYNVFMGGNNGQAFVIANTGGVFLGSGATGWSGISDARLKNVTGTYTNALNDIAQLEPVKFTWKSDAENKPQVGIIAQSVQKVVPEAVETTFEGDDPTEYLGVRYTELIPLLTAAIQELKGIVETQKTELDATKAEVAALKGAQ